MASYRFLVISAVASAFLQTALAAASSSLTITTSVLPAGTVNLAYSQTLAAGGGTQPYSNWSISSGALPAGLALDPTGLLSGTPTKAGSSSFKVTVTDAGNSSATAPLSLTIGAALTITTVSTLPAGKVNVAYSQTLAATGGTAPYSNWSITRGALPQGLALSSAGALSGTPTIAGSFNFTVGVTDHAGTTASALFQLTIAPGKLAVTSPSILPAGQVNALYSQTLAAIGGAPPYTEWTTISGSLPAGLSLSPSGVLSGLPTAMGSSSFTLQVTDSAAATASEAFQLTIGPAALVIASSSPLPAGQANVTYAQTLVASGGTPPYTWATTGGALPAGLSLSSTGVLNGTPTLWGPYTFTVRVTDHAAVSVSAPFQLTINPGTLTITTASLPQGLLGAAYSQTMAAVGGKAPYTWSANSRAPGLSFSSSGVWSGTPTAAGIFSFIVQVADSAGVTATGQFQLTISPTTPVTVTTGSPLPPGNVNSSYSQTMTANFGTPPYTNWTTTGGTLPSGLTLSTAGILSGNPTTTGTFTFTVQVIDSAGATASAQLQMTVNGAKLAVTTPSPLPAGQVNNAYSQTLAAAGGTPPYTWMTYSVTPGLTLSPAGVLSGTPTTAGTNGLVVQVTDSASVTASAVFQLTINPPPLIITTSTLAAGQVGAGYSVTMTATGGTPPYASWSTSSGTLPPGLLLSPAGLLSGVPTTAGSYSFTVQVTDKAGAMASTPFQLTINPAALAITTSSPLAVGKVGSNYSLTLAASGGSLPYASWIITNGTLPPGVTLSLSGVLSGVPTAAGTYSFTVQLTDKAGAIASASYQLTINASPLAITTPSPLPAGKVNTGYSQSLAASGGTPPYANWLNSNGALPAGVTLSSAGVLSGTPVTAGAYSFTIQVTDSNNNTASMPFQLSIAAATLAITTTSPLPGGHVNSAYTQTLAASGGTLPYANWTTSSGSLPGGLLLSSAGVLSGTPIAAGAYSFTIQVTDSAGLTASTPFQLTIAAAALAITTASPLPGGRVSTPYSQTLTAGGGTPPYSNWTISSGALPAGLTLSPAGILSGTAPAAGTYSFSVQVTDKTGATASSAFQLTIASGSLAIATTVPLPAGKVNTGYSLTMAASGGAPPYIWSINGTIPGLALTQSGVLSGTPTTAGTYNFNVQVIDNSGSSASGSFQLTISPGAVAIVTAAPLPAGKVNTGYSLTMVASGGTPPYAWIASGGAPGLTLNAAGVWSGTPTVAGTYSFTVQVTDSTGSSASGSFQLTISSAPIAITTLSPLPAGKVNAGYSQTMTSSGGTPPYTWIASGGAPGLTLSSSGVWSGTPTTTGTYSFTVQVTDSTGSSASTSFQLTINPAALAITTLSPLPVGHASAGYSQVITATGGTPPYSWTASGGMQGLTLSSSGMLSGTPTAAGTYSFTVQVTDSVGASASASFQLTISPAALAITTLSPLPVGHASAGYSQVITATGGTPPYSWTASGGMQGLTLSSSGMLSGTPTAAGTYSFTVQVTDSVGASASASFQLTISPAALAITTLSPLPVGHASAGYSQVITATGGTPPYSWTANGGMQGLTLSSSGMLSGTPTAAGTYSFTVQVTDSAGASASASFQLTINQPSPSVAAAVSSANFMGGLPLTAGSWVALYGTNLAPAGDSRLWNSATEIVNGKLPASLDGTSVTVNGKAATVEYISAGQVNIQMPDDTTIGPVPVVVTTAAGGASSSFTVNYGPFSPGFFPATAPYIVAQHADNSYVTAGSPALPGEVIVLWGGGMGAASPTVPAGQVFVGANPLANTVTVTIGGQPATLDFAGVVGAGLVQINAHVPTGIGSGDQMVVATVGGVSSPSGAYISVGTPSSTTSQLRVPAPVSADQKDAVKTGVVAIAPASAPPAVVYAGTDNGIYKSSDAGATWQQCLTSPGPLSSIHAIVVNPLHPERIYAAGMNEPARDTFFTSLDAGQTWSSDSAPPAAALALDAIATNVIYLLGVGRGGVYKSEDSGQTWSPTPLGDGVSAIVADPNVTGLVYANRSTGRSQILKSYDFGMTWTAIETVTMGNISALAVDPHDSNTLFAVLSSAGCTPCEVFRSTDSGNTWLESTQYADGSLAPFAFYSVNNSDGSTATAFSTVFTDPGNGANLYVVPGNSNGLFRSTNGGASWNFSAVLPGSGQVFSLGIPAK